MINSISDKAHEYLDSCVELLKEFISYPSVKGEPEEGKPYGKACGDMMEYAAKVLEGDGFYVRNFENHAITAAFSEADAELGILCHLDVVPVEGQSWSSDPFKAELRDDRIYGRGAIDDKGPAAAVITAMRMIRDSGIKLSRNVRLILGSDEENGSADMEYYTKKESFPPMLFTPDGSFPVINIEKGMIRYEIKGEYDDENLISFTGGSVVNAVPEGAKAVIRGIDAADAEKLCEGCKYEGVIFSVEKHEKDTICIKSMGKGAHASTPANGRNALTAMIGLLSEMPFKGKVWENIRSMGRLYPYGEWDGSGVGAKCSDEKSGDLTMVLSIAEIGGGEMCFKIDCRFPVCKKSADIVEALNRSLAREKLCGNAVMTSEPHYADENSEMIQTLLKVYEDCTGEKGRCVAIGGGTYVHDTENGVAFGAEWSDENNMHGADEFIGLDELEKDIRIYTEAILRLCM